MKTTNSKMTFDKLYLGQWFDWYSGEGEDNQQRYKKVGTTIYRDEIGQLHTVASPTALVYNWGN